MDRWLGVLAIVVGAALFIWGPKDSGVIAGQWVLWVGGVVLLIVQPLSFVWRKWRARSMPKPGLRPKGTGYMARQVLRDQTGVSSPVFPPRNGDFAYADFEAVGGTVTNAQGVVTIKDSRGVTRYGPAPTLWAKHDSEHITLTEGEVGSLNTMWKPFDADGAYPVTAQVVAASPITWMPSQFRLDPGRYEVTLEAKGDGTSTARVRFRFEWEGAGRPTEPKHR